MVNLGNKYKGLRNGQDWEIGNRCFFDDGRAVIYNENHEFHVFKESVSRFTGFTNEFGQDLYEGDLLEIDINEEGGNRGFIGIVFLDEGATEWKVKNSNLNNPKMESLINCLTHRVVGHIFTHEYLIKSHGIKLPAQLMRI